MSGKTYRLATIHALHTDDRRQTDLYRTKNARPYPVDQKRCMPEK